MESKRFNKKMLIPILTLIALFLKQIFNVDIPDQIVDTIADLIMFVVASIGFKLHPHVEQPQEVQTNGTEEPTTIIENNR